MNEILVAPNIKFTMNLFIYQWNIDLFYDLIDLFYAKIFKSYFSLAFIIQAKNQQDPYATFEDITAIVILQPDCLKITQN